MENILFPRSQSASSSGSQVRFLEAAERAQVNDIRSDFFLFLKPVLFYLYLCTQNIEQIHLDFSADKVHTN